MDSAGTLLGSHAFLAIIQAISVFGRIGFAGCLAVASGHDRPTFTGIYPAIVGHAFLGFGFDCPAFMFMAEPYQVGTGILAAFCVDYSVGYLGVSTLSVVVEYVEMLWM